MVNGSSSSAYKPYDKSKIRYTPNQPTAALVMPEVTGKKVFVPSLEQQAIFDHVIPLVNARKSGSVFIEAVAGAGKTTTLEELVKRLNISDLAVYMFNKNIKEEMAKRLPNCNVKTLNSLGYGALVSGLSKELDKRVKFNLNASKYFFIVNNLVKNIVEPKQVNSVISSALSLVNYARSTMSDLSNESLLEIMAHFNVDYPKAVNEIELFNIVKNALTQGELMAKSGSNPNPNWNHQIDYDDQIWLPVKWNMSPAKTFVNMVDEAQDLGKAKLELVLMSLKPGGVSIFVGDRNQAIYAFAGADCDSVDNIIARTNATCFPLSTSYRCPINVTKLAQTIVPHMNWASNAIDGIASEDTVEHQFMMKNIEVNHYILCRLTAPLISQCIKFLKEGKPARVKGHDIGQKIVKFAVEVMQNKEWNLLESELDSYREAMLPSFENKRNKENAISSLNDMVEAVKVMNSAYKVTSLESFANAIDSIFENATNRGQYIELLTGHRAKGLEAKYIWVIKPNTLPLRWKNQQEWQLKQEMNLRYVIITRSLYALYFVEDEPPMEIGNTSPSSSSSS